MADNEIAEIHHRVNAALIATIQAAGQVAQVLIEARVALLQRAARAGEDQARRVRAQVRAAHQADAAVWRAASRPGWWRRASTEDIARVWRAASAWSHVDARAAEMRRVVVERLAERGVHINLAEGDRPGDAGWLSDALDRAAALDDITGDELAEDVVEQRLRDDEGTPALPAGEPGPGLAEDAPASGGPTPGAPARGEEDVRAEAIARLERYRDAVRARQRVEFPSPPTTGNSIWAGYERQVTLAEEGLTRVRGADDVAAAIRETADRIQGQVGVRLRALADRLDPGWWARAGGGRPGTGRAAAGRRQEQMAAHVRAVWPAERAERVLRSEAWPVLAYKLDQLQQQGRDVQALLRQVPGFVDRAHTPAAFAFRVVDDATTDQADQRRPDGDEKRTLDGQWRETRTDRQTGRDAGRETRAARLAAAGYPASTKAAMGHAASTGDRSHTTPSSPGQAAVRPATTTQPEPSSRVEPRSR